MVNCFLQWLWQGVILFVLFNKLLLGIIIIFIFTNNRFNFFLPFSCLFNDCISFFFFFPHNFLYCGVNIDLPPM